MTYISKVIFIFKETIINLIRIQIRVTNACTILLKFFSSRCLKRLFRACSTDNFLSPIFSPYLCSLQNVTSRASGSVFGEKNATLCSHILFLVFFVVLHQKIVFLSFSFLFLMNYQICATEY